MLSNIYAISTQFLYIAKSLENVSGSMKRQILFEESQFLIRVDDFQNFNLSNIELNLSWKEFLGNWKSIFISVT